MEGETVAAEGKCFKHRLAAERVAAGKLKLCVLVRALDNDCFGMRRLGKVDKRNLADNDHVAVRFCRGFKRRRKGRLSLLPSERKNRFNRKRLERARAKERARIAEKELGGKKLTAKQLRKLRGLDRKQIKRRDLAQVRREREQSAKRTNLVRTVRKRDEYTR